MGRPPLNVIATSVRLTADIRQRITALAGENRMAVFIREAIENELLRREQASAKLSQDEIVQPVTPPTGKQPAD